MGALKDEMATRLHNDTIAVETLLKKLPLYTEHQCEPDGCKFIEMDVAVRDAIVVHLTALREQIVKLEKREACALGNADENYRRLQAAEQQIVNLTEALEPFAAYATLAEKFGGELQDHAVINVELGELRHARAALSSTKAEKK